MAESRSKEIYPAVNYMFKVDNKKTRMTPMSVILVSLLLTLNIFHTVSIVNIEQVNAGWESLPYVTWMINICDF